MNMVWLDFLMSEHWVRGSSQCNGDKFPTYSEPTTVDQPVNAGNEAQPQG